MSTSYTPEQLTAIAAAAHEAHWQFCYVNEPTRAIDKWWVLPFTKRATLIAAVLRVLNGEIATPEDAHAAWCADMHARGWSHGPEIDAVARTHPCLVAWDVLSDYDKAKDVLFLRTVSAVAEAFHTAGLLKEEVNGIA